MIGYVYYINLNARFIFITNKKQHMIYQLLGNTDLRISRICLGTMTFGQQNTYEEARDQMNLAVTKGINFFDTAEMYPVPANPSTQGETETYIGRWLKEYKKRSDLIIATKATGPGVHVAHINPHLGFSKQRLSEALHHSLSRLGTDYIDLYQLHWPERKTNCFGKMGFTPENDGWEDNIADVVDTLYSFKQQGKIRYWGLSNETPWGVMRFLQEAKRYPDFMPVSIQNPYNLVNRTFEIGLAEIVFRENIGLLAYSPLAFGLLSGKYHYKQDVPQDRLNQFKQMARYNSPVTFEATSKYLEIAKSLSVSPAILSISYLLSKPYVHSVIIGATNLLQLEENISAFEWKPDDNMIGMIENVHKIIPNPAP